MQIRMYTARSHIFQQQRNWRKITSVCRMRQICWGFRERSWQRLQEEKKLEDFWIQLSAITKGGSQERVFSYFLMLRMYITS